MSLDKNLWAALSFALAAFLSGCGMQGAPQPPSLKLPEPVTDLAARRAGSQVTLTWTQPKKNTDKLLLKGNVVVRLCRGSDVANASCLSAGDFAPGAKAAFTDVLPPELAAGSPRPLRYFVELRNRNGRSAGPSNSAVVLAGDAPAPVAGLAAEERKVGVVLHWANSEAAGQDGYAIRLHRKLLTPPAAKAKPGPLAPQVEPLERTLLVDPCQPEARTGLCHALDKSIRFGQSYEYRAQRVARVTVEGKTLELDGALSAPVRIEAADIFPPEAPTALAAVATIGENGPEAAVTATAIDLSWQPVADPALAGYIVYRREGDGAWQRCSPDAPLVPPAFHDMQVQPGHTYRYAVSAVGQNGHESPRSVEAEETVPNP
jgi:hypothetical protein